MSRIRTPGDPSRLDRALTEGRLLARNTVWNLAGVALPLLVALPTIPILVDGLGRERFGLLALVWVTIGYFGLFDIGIGRALTKLLADRLGSDRLGDVGPLVWTANVAIAVLGLAGCGVAAAVAPVLANRALEMPDALRPEAVRAFLLVALAIPFVVSTAGWRAVLEAHQRFDLLAWIRVPMGVYTFVAPVVALAFARGLVVPVAVLAAGRIVAWAVHLRLAFVVAPSLRGGIRLRPGLLRPLLTFGGWMTVSNIVSPVMVYLDRFLIGVLLSAGAVTFYATPYEVVTRLLMVPSALVGVLFPAFATSLASDPASVSRMFGKGVGYVLLALVPVVVTICAFAPDGLAVWLGSDFVVNSTFVLRCLALGVLANAVGRLAFGLIQAAGRPDITATLHLIEACVYVPVLWWSVVGWGIDGAAVVWTGRMVVDTAVLLAAVTRTLPAARRTVLRIGLALASGLAVSTGAALAPPGPMRAWYPVVVFAVLLPLAWFKIFGSSERALVRGWATGIWGAAVRGDRTGGA